MCAAPSYCLKLHAKASVACFGGGGPGRHDRVRHQKRDQRRVVSTIFKGVLSFILTDLFRVAILIAYHCHLVVRALAMSNQATRRETSVRRLRSFRPAWMKSAFDDVMKQRPGWRPAVGRQQ